MAKTAIDRARDEGYSDEEIMNFLNQQGVSKEQIAAAKANGYDSKEILDYLSKQMLTPAQRKEEEKSWPTKAMSGVNVGFAETAVDPFFSMLKKAALPEPFKTALLAGITAFAPEGENKNMLLQNIDKPLTPLRDAEALVGWAPAPGDEPEGYAFAAGRGAGRALGMFGLLTAGGQGLGPSTVAPTSMKEIVAGTPGLLARKANEIFMEHPVAATALEAAAGAGSGAGGEAAAETFGEKARPAGELVGGLSALPAAGLASFYARKISPLGYVLRAANQSISAPASPLNRARAALRMQEMTRNPSAAAANETQPTAEGVNLTPAQKTGDEGLLSLERAVMESSEVRKGQRSEQLTSANQAIRQRLAQVGAAAQTDPAKARDYLVELMDSRIQQAAATAEDKLRALGPNATREEASRIQRQELEGAERSARVQEDELFRAVPNVKVGLLTTRKLYQKLDSELPTAQKEDMPAIATRFLDNEISTSAFGDEVDIKELQGLRSKLLEDARKAAAAGNNNTARLAGELSESLLTDMGAARVNPTTPAGKALRIALDFSHDLNQRFTQGFVGKTLGSAKEGGSKLPEGLTLESISRGGAKAREDFDALRAAVGPNSMLEGNVADVLKDEFMKAAVRNDQVSATSGQAFLRKHKELLSRMPELQKQFTDAVQSGEVAFNLGNPKKSRLALIAGGTDLDKVVPELLKSFRPALETRALVQEAAQDKTGQATAGLKSLFMEHILKNAVSNSEGADAMATPFLSGTRMTQIISDPKFQAAAGQVLSKDEMGRLKIIADNAVKLEKARGASAAPYVIKGPNMLLRLAGKVIGAAVGRRVGREMGGGTIQVPGYFAQLGDRIVDKLTPDKAQMLLVDAMSDQDLFNALRVESTAKPAQQRSALKSINAWLVGNGLANLAEKEEPSEKRGNSK